MNTTIFEELLASPVTKIERLRNGGDELHFHLENGKHYKFYHPQD